MTRALFGIGSLALLSLITVACTDAPADRTGEGPTQTPPAASPTTPPAESPTASPPASTPPAGSPTSPSGSATK